MFFHFQLCCKKNGKFAAAWLAATRGVKLLSRNQILSTNVCNLCTELTTFVASNSTTPRLRFSLTLSAKLINGTVKIYKQQSVILLDDLVKLLTRTYEQYEIPLYVSPVTPVRRKRKRTAPAVTPLPPRHVPEVEIPEIQVITDRMLRESSEMMAEQQEITLLEGPTEIQESFVLQPAPFEVLEVEKSVQELLRVPQSEEELLLLESRSLVSVGELRRRRLSSSSIDQPPQQIVVQAQVLRSPDEPVLPKRRRTERSSAPTPRVSRVSPEPQPEPAVEMAEVAEPEAVVVPADVSVVEVVVDGRGRDSPRGAVPKRRKRRNQKLVFREVRDVEHHEFDIFGMEQTGSFEDGADVAEFLNVVVLAVGNILFEDDEQLRDFMEDMRASRTMTSLQSSASLPLGPAQTSSDAAVPPAEEHTIQEFVAEPPPHEPPHEEMIVEVLQDVVPIPATTQNGTTEATREEVAVATIEHMEDMEEMMMEPPEMMLSTQMQDTRPLAESTPAKRNGTLHETLAPAAQFRELHERECIFEEEEEERVLDQKRSERQARLLKIIKEWDFNYGPPTIEDVCPKPVVRLNAAATFSDLLTLAKLKYVKLVTLVDSIELSHIEKGERLLGRK